MIGIQSRRGLAFLLLFVLRGSGRLLRLSRRGSLFTVAAAQTSETERNKAIVRAYKETAKTKSAAALQAEYFAPNYKRLRGGLQNLANNAAGQGFPDNGEYLRGAIPDRNDIVEEIVAEGDALSGGRTPSHWTSTIYPGPKGNFVLDRKSVV